MDHFYNHLAHTLLIGPLLVFIGMKQSNFPDYANKLILGTGLFVFAYHLFKAYEKITEKGFISAWVNYIHVLLVAPVLIAIGYYGSFSNNTPRYLREVCMMLGFAAFGYHAYYLFV